MTNLQPITKKSLARGLLGAAILLTLYLSSVSLISGWEFTLVQFSQFWYFIILLAIGFGIQVGLYTYLKNATQRHASKGVVAVTGTTSSLAMLSCCAHYLVNIFPIIGLTGIISLIGQYQVKLFWLSLAANLLGIIYISNKLLKFSRTTHENQ